MSSHRVRTAAHHVLLFVQKPTGLSGAAHGPAKVLPLRPHGATRSGRPAAFTWGLLVLGVILLAAVLVIGLHVSRELVGSHLVARLWR